MNKHFVCQLDNAMLITKNNKDKKQLKWINKQHNFIALRAFYNEDYETEMKRSMLLEKLQHIHENLCLKSGKSPSKPYKERRPIECINQKIQSCQDCGDKFSLENGSAELV